MKATNTILLPRHCSYALRRMNKGKFHQRQNTVIATTIETDEDAEYHRPRFVDDDDVVILSCRTPGLVWRELHPVLFLAPSRIAKRALYKIASFHHLQRSDRLQRKLEYQPHGQSVVSFSAVSPLQQDTDETLLQHHFCRTLGRQQQQQQRRGTMKSVFYILPPTVTNPDRLFCGIVIQWEHLFLQMQSLSAWWATLGGGYFLCRRLSTAVRLARQQRTLAIWMGDVETADRCTLNEAYNFLHAGQFAHALVLIRSVQRSAKSRNDVILLRMCQSARLFRKRMMQACRCDGGGVLSSTTINSSNNNTTRVTATVDDYQRIRIVPEQKLL